MELKHVFNDQDRNLKFGVSKHLQINSLDMI